VRPFRGATQWLVSGSCRIREDQEEPHAELGAVLNRHALKLKKDGWQGYTPDEGNARPPGSRIRRAKNPALPACMCATRYDAAVPIV
jgi:hypothetical protein